MTYGRIRDRGSRRLRSVLPAIATGTFDYLNQPSNVNHQGIVECMVRSGMPVPADMSLAELKQLAYGNLQALCESKVISKYDADMFIAYYGLDRSGLPAAPDAITKQYGLGTNTLCTNIRRSHHAMLMASAKRDGPANPRQPLITPGQLRAVLRDYGLPQF
jgi:hypothetical protein